MGSQATSQQNLNGTRVLLSSLFNARHSLQSSWVRTGRVPCSAMLALASTRNMLQPRIQARAKSLVLIISIVCILIFVFSASLGREYLFFKPQQSNQAKNNKETHQRPFPFSENRLSFISRTRHGVPIYNSSADPSSAPRFLSSAQQLPFSPAGSSLEQLKVLLTHPRLFASAEKWKSLEELTKKDPYLHSWNHSIFKLAEQQLHQSSPAYVVDGTNGVLDIARTVQLRIKLWCYAYHLSGGHVQWKNLVWNELVLASGNSSSHYFGPEGDNWNSGYVPPSPQTINLVLLV